MDNALLQNIPLFAGFSEGELAGLLAELAPLERVFDRGEILLAAGAEAGEIGILLYGRIEAVKETRQGGRFLMTKIGPGGVFGDVLSGGHSKSPVTVTADSRCRVLLLPYARLLAPRPGAEALYRRLLANLVGVISDKYFALDRRIDLLLTGGLRRRISAFLLKDAARRNSYTFTIPYNRTQLAQYLGCERSALSREISRMAKEGLIATEKARFTLLRPDLLQNV